MPNKIQLGTRLISKYLPEGTKGQILRGLREGRKEANRYINSIFTEANKNNLKTTGAVMAALGLTQNTAKAAVEKADKAAEWVVPFYSATKDQIATVRDYLDGRIDKDEYYKRINNATLSNAVDGLLLAIGGKAAGAVAKKLASTTIGKVITTAAKSGTKAATTTLNNAIATARNELVRQSPKAMEAIKKGTDLFKGSINDVVKKFTPKGDVKDYQMATLDEFFGNPEVIKVTNAAELDKALLGGEKELIGLVKENASMIKNLADEVGVKSAKEIPNLLKFTKEFGDILKNAPANIKAQATGNKMALLANTGLSVYDLYQAYKDNDGTLLPRLGANAVRIAGGLIPGNTILKVLYGQLGYTGADKLARAALRRIGAGPKPDEQLQKDYESGMAYPGLQDELGQEYLTGQSGRRYHVVGDKVYAFDTGRPVPVDQALDDADAYITFQTQQAQDKLNIVNQQIADAERAQQMGYDVPPIEGLYIEKQNLEGQLQNLKPISAREPEYDDNQDLVEQYTQRVVAPQQQAQQAKQMEQQANYNQIYNDVVNKIATDTYNDIENYYTPENQAIDYYQYMLQVGRGEAQYLSPEQFTQIQKAKAIYQLGPTIRQNAQTFLNNLMSNQIKQGELGVKKFQAGETQRHNLQTEATDVYKANVDAQNKQATQTIEKYKAQSGRIQAETGRQNAITNRMEIPIKQQQAKASMINANVNQQLMPYRQGAYMGEALMNASMSDLKLDNFLNTNQSVMSQIFPGTQQQNQMTPQQQQVQNIRNYYNQQGQQ